MVIKKNILGLFLGFIICFLISGCSVPIHSYIRNTSTTVQSIFVTFVKNPEKPILLYYRDLEKELTFDIVKELDKTITVLPTQNGTYEIILPPKSTVFMEQSLIFRNLIYKSITVKNIELINGNGVYSQILKTKREGLSKYVIWFDIE